jgi:uncharacterized repeat protein (TIGR03803 family)
MNGSTEYKAGPRNFILRKMPSASRKTAAGLAAILVLASAALSTAGAASVFTPLYWFKSTGPNAGFAGPLTLGPNAIYGQVDNAYGFIFQLTPPASGSGLWTFKNLHAFNGNDGNMPVGSLLLSDGKLIGSTGSSDPNGISNVYELAPPATAGKPWSLSQLHIFSATVPDRGGSGTLLTNKAGQLVGEASLGGPNSNGTIFALTPPAKAGGKWVEKVLYAFTGKDGLFPIGGLLQDTDGTLYGTTTNGGGRLSYGTVFQLSPPAPGKTKWTHTILYSFTGQSDTGFPQQKLAFDASHQHLYGISGIAITGQQGTVFSLTRPAAGQKHWTYSLLHTFKQDFVDGYLPQAVVVIGKNIYGTTKGGGTYDGGIIYRLSPPAKAGGAWTETILHDFTNGRTDGASPGELTAAGNGVFYGTTISGGPPGDAGGVFSFKP